jgi:hypothetical protein
MTRFSALFRDLRERFREAFSIGVSLVRLDLAPRLIPALVRA